MKLDCGLWNIVHIPEALTDCACWGERRRSDMAIAGDCDFEWERDGVGSMEGVGPVSRAWWPAHPVRFQVWVYQSDRQHRRGGHRW